MTILQDLQRTPIKYLRKFFLVYLGQLEYIENNILNPRYDRYLKQHDNQFPDLNSQASVILKDLQETGIHATSLEALGLPNLTQFLDDSERLGQELKQTALSISKERTSVTALSSQLVKYQDIYLWGLNSDILAIVERFLGLPVAYGLPTFRLRIANYVNKDAGHWHKDIEDRRMIKIVVYLTDIGENGSPFEYWDLESSSRIINIIKQNHPLRGVYKPVSHQSLLKLVPLDLKGKYKTCTGLRGTVLFIDVCRLLHRLKPAIKDESMTVFYGYHTRRPSYPFFCGPGHFSNKDLNFLAESLSNPQKDCVFWRNELNPIQRFLLKI